jgi:hypothetical protein
MVIHNIFKKYYISLILVDKSFMSNYKKRGRLRRVITLTYNKRLQWRLNKRRYILKYSKNIDTDL